MKNTYKITKGLDIPLSGIAAPDLLPVKDAEIWSVSPNDHHGVTPRLLVQVGDSIKAGDPVFCDKNRPEVLFVSPVCGTVIDIVRGDKRKLNDILIKIDGPEEYKTFQVGNPLDLSGEEVKNALMESGLWPTLKQRPYDLIANPYKTPRDIFVTGFDSSPLAPDYDFVLKGHAADLQKGFDALSRLTDGKVYLGLSDKSQAPELTQLNGVEIVRFEGPHPAGLVGVQINRIKPLNKGELVYTANALDVASIGRFFNQGKTDLGRLVALTGPMIRKPAYIRCKPGIAMHALLDGNVYKEANVRVIAGNVLTGVHIDPKGYLPAGTNQITVLREGEGIHELFGWAMPRLNAFSFSRTYFTKLVQRLQPSKKYDPDTRVLGGERALIMSGEYEKVFPMDILPEHLTRACITGNIERQEDLGIYEVAPEDFALCEYICTSKIQVQQVVRTALDRLKAENGD